MARSKRGVLIERARVGRLLLEQVAAERGVRVADIVGPFCGRLISSVRREFCERAKALGLGTTTIGRLITRDAGTVQYHLRPDIRERKRQCRNRWNEQRRQANEAARLSRGSGAAGGGDRVPPRPAGSA